VFSPVAFKSMQLVDGGVRDNLAIKAIRNDPDISVTIVLCSPLSMQITPKKYKNIFKISGRVIDMMMDEGMRNDLENMLLIDEILKSTNEKSRIKMYLEASGKKIINAKIIAPKILVTESSLEFNQEDLIKGFELGENFSEIECKPLFV